MSEDEAIGSRETELLAARRTSMEKLERAGMPAFALTLERALGVAEQTPIAAVRAAHGELGLDDVTGTIVTLAGRVVLKRDIGKLKFLVVRDRSGDLQMVASSADLPEDQFTLLDEVDLGDIIGVTGRVGTTRKGELSVFADRWAMLTKALRPLPEKWHGLQDPDLQQRRRYLHLIADEAPRRAFLARSAVLKTMRRVLDDRGFVEFEGPMLQTVAGGANARPFTTHHHALDTPMKLRISLELYLKRMLVGGVERVYELGRNFRNEGIDRDHNPEFTMLEAYQAYGDYHSMMELSEVLLTECARAVNPIVGRDADDLRISVQGRTIDLTPPFARITILGSVSDAVGESVTLDHPGLPTLATHHGVHVERAWGPGKIVQELFEKLVEGTIEQPTFVCDFPREVSPLARPHRDDPGLTEHFDLVAAGIELVTAFSELTDPIEQRAKFELQQQMKEVLGDEVHPFDEDFLRALEHGMPPVGGLGMGIDRTLLLLTDAASLRDLIMFPSQRPE
ncbi:MAG: lysine--tRNA ligase [Actinomycetota bacterium]|nr:lysine--tRNA ligase [Actinomycetota bacterium]MDH5223166.1 lysine--tRNA ligase [Actinomycetota bacterium]MDH5312218.1 lysine--tRNA ligase [Actinomycetota bacterium]